MDMAAGQSIDKSMFVDRRDDNSRGGKGIGFTDYGDFLKACEEFLLPTSATKEHLHSDTIYASGAYHIPNLIKLAAEILQQKVNCGTLNKLPPILYEDWVCLQFVPNNAEHAAISTFTDCLTVKRAVQRRTLRKEHMDQHWVNAMMRYYLGG